MFDGLEYKIVDNTETVVETGTLEDWVKKSEDLRNSPDFRIIYYRCPREICQEWHPLCLYYNGKEYVYSRVVDAIATIVTEDLVTTPKWDLPEGV